jgi:hypothetical protein
MTMTIGAVSTIILLVCNKLVPLVSKREILYASQYRVV